MDKPMILATSVLPPDVLQTLERMGLHVLNLSAPDAAKPETPGAPGNAVPDTMSVVERLTRMNREMTIQIERVAGFVNVAKSLAGVIELEDLLGACAQVMCDSLGCSSVTVALYDSSESAIGLMARALKDSDDPPALMWLRSPVASGVMCRAVQTGKSVHIEDIAGSVLLHTEEKKLWPEGSLLITPIIFMGVTAVGVAVLHRGKGDADFSASEVRESTDLVDIMGGSIHSAMVNHHQRCQIYSALESITEAVENRDPYLKGHSRRVQAYAQQVAPALELAQNDIGALQIAARLHDIGWIVIPESIVGHPGPLTEERWDVVRRHPEAGANFLKNLDFFGEVAEIVRTHHESYDGTGYPDRKAGEEIPPVARVIAVTDAFDAMTSPRPHRPALSIEDALKQIRKLAGQQFDPQVAEALLEVPVEVLEEIKQSRR